MQLLRKFEDHVVGEMTDHERSILRHSALWFFLVLCGYYQLRPIREQISAEYGIKNLAWLFKATFITMLVAIPVYSLLVSKFDRKKLVPCIYAFFVASLLLFWAAMRFIPETLMLGETSALEYVARVMFIWISVYGLFVVSFFWSVVGDMLSSEQGRRLFGFVMGGGTIGGMFASLITANIVERIGQANLLLMPAVLLVTGLMVYFSLERSFRKSNVTLQSKRESGRATGGNPLAGFTAVFRSRYLFCIVMYTLMLALCGTMVYFQQSEIVNSAIDTKEAQTKFFAKINLAVQIVTLILQTVVVGRLMKNLGLGITLAVLPLAYIFGVSWLAIDPSLAVLAVISVTGRSAEYAIANPAREVLFTAVRREERYKAKSFIDTIVRRGGDTAAGSIYEPLRQTLGVAMTTLSWCVVPIAMLWVGLGLFIGGENKRVVARQNSQESLE